MPSVWLESRKLKHGKRWYVYGRVGGKARILSPGTYHKNIAHDMKDKIEREGINQDFDILDQKLSLENVISKYILSCQNSNKKPSTITHKKFALKKLTGAFPGKRIASISSTQIERFKNDLLDNGQDVNGVIIYLRAIKTFFRFSVKNGYIRENPAQNILENLKEKKVARFLTKNEVETLWDACIMPELKDIVWVALHTGMRRGEILQMQAEDVKDGLIKVYSPKTDSTRFVEVHNEIKGILQRVKRGQIFLGWNKDRLKSAFRRTVDRINRSMKKEGLPAFGRLRFHDLRHTFASRYLEAGGTLADLKEILGHKTLAALQKYTHFQRPYLNKRINKVSY